MSVHSEHQSESFLVDPESIEFDYHNLEIETIDSDYAEEEYCVETWDESNLLLAWKETLNSYKQHHHIDELMFEKFSSEDKQNTVINVEPSKDIQAVEHIDKKEANCSNSNSDLNNKLNIGLIESENIKLNDESKKDLIIETEIGLLAQSDNRTKKKIDNELNETKNQHKKQKLILEDSKDTRVSKNIDIDTTASYNNSIMKAKLTTADCAVDDVEETERIEESNSIIYDSISIASQISDHYNDHYNDQTVFDQHQNEAIKVDISMTGNQANTSTSVKRYDGVSETNHSHKKKKKKDIDLLFNDRFTSSEFPEPPPPKDDIELMKYLGTSWYYLGYYKGLYEGKVSKKKGRV
ncbi:hypothetical protein BB561_002423 [Smittium simulii]|uniref:Survival motor neuron Tudor domain-containing protein n=1 Tax=Smittium simulii TaxID=133385 RepID=A0A2T9YQI8_9FUNG|nr:hypothetical protein BB561_002423 [Smittium simulii]